MFMRAGARRQVGQMVLLRVYGVIFLLVIALLVGLTVAIYSKVFINVVHVTLQTDRVGNQLAPPADVKLRGLIVGEVRSVHSDGAKASVDLALQPSMVGLIPRNISARLLPKTLFGEKFVDLVLPAKPSPLRLSEGDVIPQDRSSTAIELETVLDNILPLLRTIKPEKLNATLDALSTALEGRGAELGKNLALVNQYFSQLNPAMPIIDKDIRGLADVSQIYAAAAPDLVRTLRNFSVTTETIAEKQKAYAGFLTGTAAFATTTRTLLASNEARIIRLASVSRATLAVLAKYSPEYPCLLQGIAESNNFIGDTFANGELHITLEVVKAQAAYKPGDEPQFSDKSGPSCHGLPRPPVPIAPTHLNDGTGASSSGDVVPGGLVDPSSGLAGSAEERQVIDSLVAPVMGVPADRVPDLVTLLFGPMARGTAVGQS